MKWKVVFFGMVVFSIGLNCSQSKELTGESQERVRNVKPGDISSYHEAVKMEIAWMPYQEHKLVKSKKNEWKVEKDDAGKQSAMPVILVSYPKSRDTFFFDMNIANESLGRLLKHTLMTQEPITRPFTDYLETAKCSKCHPAHINKGFE
jgi:hypothetical protein